MIWQKAILLFLLISAGCSSARSTLLHRGELDQQWETERLLHGVPVTVQVPTHIKLEIVEHRYLGLVDAEIDSDGTAKPDTGRIDWLDADSLDIPVRSVRHELIETAKIFTVDPKRPAAGTMDATMTFGGANGQYFDQIDYFVEDKTIEAVTELIGQVAKQGLFGVPTAEDDTGEEVDTYLHRVDTVVASSMFSLDAPDLELQMACFLERHLNACHTCQIVPPGVVIPERLPPVINEPCMPEEATGGAVPFLPTPLATSRRFFCSKRFANSLGVPDMKYCQCVMLFMTVALSGCASFSSTLLYRAEDNTDWEKKRLLCGVPITLKVPTHIRIDVTERHFLVLDSVDRQGKTYKVVQRRSPKFPIRQVTYTMIETEKIFVVDLKRPGAGTIDATIDFDPNDQYFDEIKTKVVDETIVEIGNLIAQIAPSGLIGTPTAEDGKAASFRKRVKELTTVVASKVFEIEAPDFEYQVKFFLDRHLNCCHDCSIVPVGTAPAVELPGPAAYPLILRPTLMPPAETSETAAL